MIELEKHRKKQALLLQRVNFLSINNNIFLT